MKKLILLFVTLILLSCIPNKSTNIPVFNISDAQLGDSVDFYLSTIIDDILIIPLQTDRAELINGYQLASNENYIFTPSPEGICQFSRNNGDFMGRIAHKGNGPGEYIHIKSLIATQTPDILYLQPFNLDYLYCYNPLNLKFVNSFDPKLEYCRIFNADINGTLYTFKKDNLLYSLGKGDTIFSLVKTPFNTMQPAFKAYEDTPWQLSNLLGMSSIQFKGDNIYLRNSFFSDTIYISSGSESSYIPFVVLSDNAEYKGKLEQGAIRSSGKSEKTMELNILYISDKIIIVSKTCVEIINFGGGAFNINNLWLGAIVIDIENGTANPIKDIYLSEDLPIKMPNDYTFWRVYYSVTPKYFSKLVHADYIREIDGTLTEDSNPVLITGSRK